MASIGPLALGAKGCVERLYPTGKTTHYILCVAPLLQNVFAVHRFAQGTPIGGQDSDGASYRCSAPYTLCLFEAFPSRGNEKIGGTRYCVTYDTDSQSRNVLVSPLGEEGHEVAKGWTVVILIMILYADVTAAGGL